LSEAALSHKQRCVIVVRSILPLLAMLIASLGFVAPAAAERVHLAAHAHSPVAVGAQHDHGALGQIEIHDEAPDDSSNDDGQDHGLGHSHGLQVAGEFIAGSPALTLLLAFETPPHPLSGVAQLETLDPPPQDRPPRVL
jgi:hypothetical protein